MNLNKAIIVGRVTADPQLRSTPGGQSVCSLSIATNRTWNDKSNQKQEEVEFHNIVLWGKQAEIAGKYVVKGALLMIEGRLRTRTWKDKNGNDRRTTEIIGERLQLGPRPTAKPQADVTEAKAVAEEMPALNLDTEGILLDEIPF